jgi:hypothetical protein
MRLTDQYTRALVIEKNDGGVDFAPYSSWGVPPLGVFRRGNVIAAIDQYGEVYSDVTDSRFDDLNWLCDAMRGRVTLWNDECYLVRDLGPTTKYYYGAGV